MNFRNYLENELSSRMQKNSQYSLRAFAQALSVDHSLLSKILNGKRVATEKFIEESGDVLNLTKQQVDFFKTYRCESEAPQTEFLEMNEDQFHFLSDWKSFALLELIKADGRYIKDEHISRRLGITDEETQQCLERLERIQVIKRENGQIFFLKSDNTWMNSEKTSVAKKLYQKKIASLSCEAIDKFDFDSRDHSSLTLACNKKLIPTIRKRIFEFRKELDAFVQAYGDEDEVYQLSVGFFPLTKSQNNSQELS